MLNRVGPPDEVMWYRAFQGLANNIKVDTDVMGFQENGLKRDGRGGRGG